MVIYRTTNTINGKWYIGKDVKNYKGYLGSGLAIKNAIQKYGKENFTKEILEVCESKEHLSEREIYWIEITDAKNNPNSYNMTDGGQGGNLSEFRKISHKGKSYEEIMGKDKAESLKKLRSESIKGDKNPMYGKSLSEEHIQKMRIANQNRVYHFDEEARKNMSLAQKGKKLSEETKKKMSEVRTGKEKAGVAIEQYDMEGNLIREFKSAKDASRTLNISYKDCQYIIYGNPTHINRHKIILKRKI